MSPRIVKAALLTVLLLSHGVLAQQETPAVPPADFAPAWTPLFAGIDHAHVTRDDPALEVHAVRIALHAPGVEFLVTPANGAKPKETDAQTTSSFLREHGLQLAVNASPYGPVTNRWGDPRDIVGLSVSRGDRYSEPHGGNGMLIITRHNRARLCTPPDAAEDAYNAVGGFAMVLRAGENIGRGGKRHPRTAAGVSEDGRYLYLMTIDGRQPASVGATTAETAAWLEAFGACDGLNLDGGGSTALAVDDGQGGARLLNTPIHLGLPGLERPNGNNLGVYAKPLPGK